MNVNNMRYLLLLLPITLLAQIPGTYRVTGPVAPTATNSNYGASIPVYNYGGFLTGLGSLSELQNLNIYPLARRHAGQLAVLTNGVAYQLGSDLTTWTTYAGWTNFQTVNNFTVKTNLTTSTVTLANPAYTNSALVYQPESGGFAIRYGDPSSYRYAVLYSSGQTTLPSGIDALGYANFGTVMTRYGFASVTNYPDGVPIGTLSVSSGTTYLDSLTRSGASYTYNPLRIRASNVVSDSEISVENIAIGNGPGNQASNTRIGVNAFNGTALGQHNVVIGANAAPVATTPTNNVIIGSNAGLSITSSDNNVVLGKDAYTAASFGSSNPSDPSYSTGAHNNIVFGRSAMANLYRGRNNFAAGTFSMFAATNAYFNVGLGTHTLNDFISGDGNTAIGESSLYKNTGGYYNTALGYLAGYNSTGSGERNVYLGFMAGPSSLTTQSNKLYIHNAAGTPLIGGDFANYTVTMAGRLGLGVDPNPNKTLTTKNQGGILVENPSNVETEIAVFATGAAFTAFGYNGGATTNPYGAPSGSVYFGTPQQKDVWISSNGGRLKISSPNGTTTWITVTSLPTSTNSLPTGTIWNDGGTLKVVP